jgi:hypothetical protein
VLDHVHAEELERNGVDRRGEGDEQRDETEEEQRGAPDRPRPARARATEIDDGREDREGDED